MSSLPEISISVTDPTKCTEKFSQVYISYKIHSNTTRAGFESGAHSVVRRYSDFTWLSQELSKEYPGVIVPPLPEKLTVGRFGEDFIESRRRALEKFLQRVAAHPELSNSQFFIVFLQAAESGLNEAKNESKTTTKAKSSNSIGWFEGTVNNLTTSSKPELEKSAADIKTEEIAQYIAQLEKQLTSVTKHAENLVKRSRDTSLAFFEFGQGFSFMGQSEGDTVGSALSELGTTANTLAGSVHNFAEAEVVKLVEPLEEYSRMLQSIKLAMQQRAAKKTAYINFLIDVEAKTNAYRKLQGVPGKESQAEQKEQLVVASQDGADAAKAEFEKVSERLLTEFELFKNQKAFDIKDIMSNFVNLQIEFNRQCEDAWAKLIPVIEGVVVEDPSYVRSKVQEQNANDSLTPPLHYTIGRAGRAPTAAPSAASTSAASGFGGGYAPPESSNTGYGGSNSGGNSPHESYPAPPSCPPPSAPPAVPPAHANPFGGEASTIQGVRKQSYAFTDEEGDGGDDEEVEEV